MNGSNNTLFAGSAVLHRFVNVDGMRIFVREAGPVDAPVILLLHGFPSSSHQYRNLIPMLAQKFRVIAPDFPGFGFTEVPSDRNYVYTFDGLAKTLEAFVEELNLKRYAMYVFDYGAPIGFRLALAHPERVSAIISQNGNAYLEGLGAAWDPIKTYWASSSLENREALKNILSLDGTRWQYAHGVSRLEDIAPESYTLDALLMERPGNKDIQLDLFLDYANNLKLYQEFQCYFRKSQVPTLVIWGQNDPFFLPAGAYAYKQDNHKATVELLDTGHFALETHCEYIANRIDEVLGAEIN